MTTNTLTLRDKEPLRDNLETYFEDPLNLNYKILHLDRLDFLLTANNQFKSINEIPCFYSMKDTTTNTLRDTDFSMINGHNLRVTASYQKARFKSGYWLEMAIQLSLKKAHIDFMGNSTNLNHYPHSLGLNVYIETDYLLMEATNLTKRLNFKDFQEKNSLFHKTRPRT